MQRDGLQGLSITQKGESRERSVRLDHGGRLDKCPCAVTPRSDSLGMPVQIRRNAQATAEKPGAGARQPVGRRLDGLICEIMTIDADCASSSTARFPSHAGHRHARSVQPQSAPRPPRAVRRHRRLQHILRAPPCQRNCDGHSLLRPSAPVTDRVLYEACAQQRQAMQIVEDAP